MTEGNDALGYALRLVALAGGLIGLAGLGAIVLVAVSVASTSDLGLPFRLPLPDRALRWLVYGGVAAMVAGAVVNVVGNFFAGMVRTTARRGDAATAEGGAGANRLPTAERYRRKLGRMYASLATFVFLLVAIDVFGASFVGSPPSSVATVVLLYAELAVRILFGSVVGAVVTAGLFAGLWYGIRVRSTEALLAGFVLGVLFLPVAAAIRSVGFAIAALLVLYYSIKARTATEFRLLETTDVPGTVRRFVGSSSE